MKKGLYQLKKMILELAEVATDKGVLISDGEIAVDAEVYVLDENGEEVAAPDGEYTAEDGRVFVVAEGKVAEIREAEQKPEEAPAEEAPVEENQEEQEPEQPAEEPEADEKDAKIAELQAQIEELNNIIAEKDEEIGRLKAELEKSNEQPAEEQLKSQKTEEMKPWFKPRF